MREAMSIEVMRKVCCVAIGACLLWTASLMGAEEFGRRRICLIKLPGQARNPRVWVSQNESAVGWVTDKRLESKVFETYSCRLNVARLNEAGERGSLGEVFRIRLGDVGEKLVADDWPQFAFEVSDGVAIVAYQVMGNALWETVVGIAPLGGGQERLLAERSRAIGDGAEDFSFIKNASYPALQGICGRGRGGIWISSRTWHTDHSRTEWIVSSMVADGHYPKGLFLDHKTVLLFFVSHTQGGEVKVAKCEQQSSHKKGLKWTNVAEHDVYGGMARAVEVAAVGDKVYLLVADARAEAQELHLLRSTDEGESWIELGSVEIDLPGEVADVALAENASKAAGIVSHTDGDETKHTLFIVDLSHLVPESDKEHKHAYVSKAADVASSVED